MRGRMYHYGLIGNCQISAHVSDQASIDWFCVPKPDSPPVFGKLLDPDGGSFSVVPEGEFSTSQSYIPHTNILLTHFKCRDGGEFRVIDFCPRFSQFGRMFRPVSLMRMIEPVKGECRIRVICDPVMGWKKTRPHMNRANSHLRWGMDEEFLRLYTNMSLTTLGDGSSFLLSQKLYFALTWGSSLQEDLQRLSEDYLRETERYWNTWVKHCSIPTLFQEETIRSALALKLHCYEDTGAILAALTTSLPEEIGGSRNWDYRFCWLRDAYFVLSALNALGHFEETEQFLKFLLNVVADTDLAREGLSPVYGLDHQRPSAEFIVENWQGFAGSAPVRVNNQASEHVQNDVYGEMVLSLSPVFFDARFRHLRTKEIERLLISLLNECAARIGQVDAGPWEIRTEWREHSFSNLACYAGLARGVELQRRGILREYPSDLNAEMKAASDALARAVRDGTLRNGPKDETVDASLLLLPIFRHSDLELCHRTVNQIFQGLQIPGAPKGFLYRYDRKDDFGIPQSAFLVCGFWLVQALAKCGRYEEARAILDNLTCSANSLGLYAEHFDPRTGVQSGNFPQAYSHVGLINSAFAVSPAWSDLL
ncbi:MAG: glycoside hydrolase family 15 protein [Limisphaerales bacterium]